MESSASKCNRALPSAIEPICFGAQLRERYTLKSDIYQLSVLIAGSEHLNVNLESKRYFVFLTHSQTLFEHTFSPCLLNVHTGQ